MSGQSRERIRRERQPDLHELHAPGSAALDEHISLTTLESLREERDQLVVRFAVDGRGLEPCDPAAVSQLLERTASRIRLDLHGDD